MASFQLASNAPSISTGFSRRQSVTSALIAGVTLSADRSSVRRWRASWHDYQQSRSPSTSARRHIKLIHSPAERLGLNMAARRHFRFSPECEVAHTSPQNISRKLRGPRRRRGDGAMAAGEPTICEICKRGRVTKRMEKMAFRQWSDKGYIQCRVNHLGRHLR